MRIPNGQCECQDKGLAGAPGDTRHESKVQKEFLNFVRFQGIQDIVESLKKVHEMALYHTDLVIDDEERVALFHVKILWEEMEKLKKES